MFARVENETEYQREQLECTQCALKASKKPANLPWPGFPFFCLRPLTTNTPNLHRTNFNRIFILSKTLHRTTIWRDGKSPTRNGENWVTSEEKCLLGRNGKWIATLYWLVVLFSLRYVTPNNTATPSVTTTTNALTLPNEGKKKILCYFLLIFSPRVYCFLKNKRAAASVKRKTKIKTWK